MEQELEGRLSEGNTLERRYRNHLRDTGLYGGPVDLTAIRETELRMRVERIEQPVHAACLLEEAVQTIRSSMCSTAAIAELTRIGPDTGYDTAIGTLYDARQAIVCVKPGDLRALRAIIDYAIERVGLAAMKPQVGPRQGYRGIIDRVEPELAPLLVSAGVPKEAALVIAHQPTPSVARRIVRAGRYLLRTKQKCES